MAQFIDVTTDFARRLGKPVDFDWFLGLQGEVFRQLPDRRTLRFHVGSETYFIKIHTGVGWREIFKNLSQGRLPVLGARNEYLAIQRLHQLGVETMTLAAYGCRGWNPARLQSFVVTEALEDCISLEDFCQDWPRTPPPLALKRALIARVARIARTLHENGLNHRDLYICHLLLGPGYDDPDRLRLFVIDLHRVQIRRRTPFRWQVKDIAALHFSSMDIGLTRNDRLRFIRIYRGRPLRSVLAEETIFWLRVQSKAEALYASYPGREPKGS